MLVHRICKLNKCKKEFIATRPNQKYCCKRCRLTACELRAEERKKKTQRRYNPKTGQMCWRCQNSTDANKCPWSIGIPVDGWIAKKVKYEDSGDYTYSILFCPKFKEDTY